MGLLSKAEGKQDFLNDTLKKYFSMNSSVEGLIIDITEEKKDNISAMVSHFALAEELPSGQYLILFPSYYDRDLIAHRLKNNLGNEISLIFSAGNLAEAHQKIQPYL